MPYYDYACRACSHAFTVRRGFHDDAREPCPECGANAERRLSLPAIVYKGSGFYTTDYGGRRVPAASGSGDGAEGESASQGGDGDAHGHGGGSDHAHPHDFGPDA